MGYFAIWMCKKLQILTFSKRHVFFRQRLKSVSSVHDWVSAKKMCKFTTILKSEAIQWDFCIFDGWQTGAGFLI